MLDSGSRCSNVYRASKGGRLRTPMWHTSPAACAVDVRSPRVNLVSLHPQWSKSSGKFAVLYAVPPAPYIDLTLLSQQQQQQ